MPSFAYKAKKGPVEITSGVIQADTMNEAVSKLTNDGQMPIEIKPYEEPKRTPLTNFNSRIGVIQSNIKINREII